MEVVINIPQKAYEQIIGFPQQTAGVDILILHKILQEGKVLPKGHGRLIDADALDDNCDWCHTDDDGSWCYKCKDIDNAPTIIEADKEEAEE